MTTIKVSLTVKEGNEFLRVFKFSFPNEKVRVKCWRNGFVIIIITLRDNGKFHHVSTPAPF